MFHSLEDHQFSTSHLQNVVQREPVLENPNSWSHFFFLLDGLMVGRKCIHSIQHIRFSLVRFRSRPGWWRTAQLDHWEKREMLDQSQSSSLAGSSIELHSRWLRLLHIECVLWTGLAWFYVLNSNTGVRFESVRATMFTRHPKVVNMPWCPSCKSDADCMLESCHVCSSCHPTHTWSLRAPGPYSDLTACNNNMSF